MTVPNLKEEVKRNEWAIGTGTLKDVQYKKGLAYIYVEPDEHGDIRVNARCIEQCESVDEVCNVKYSGLDNHMKVQVDLDL